DRGIAPAVRDQGLLAERVAGLQFGDAEVGPAHPLADLAAAGFDQVEIVAYLALVDHRLPPLDPYALEAPQEFGDVRRRQLGQGTRSQGLGAERPGHRAPLGGLGFALGLA